MIQKNLEKSPSVDRIEGTAKAVYVRPVLVEMGDSSEVTNATPTGSRNDGAISTALS